MACPDPPPRQKIPKDGPGPRGVPDCYYTSRVLNSTGRYVKFVKKLRAKEEEERRGAFNKLKELKDQQTNDFFIRCDRRSLINNVARRVDLCLASYEQDLTTKRHRLITLLQAEEEENIRKFIVQAQAGAEALWQDKKDRLAYLLAKRKKEHEEKYKDTPLSKSSHVLGCIYTIRAREAQEYQLYQMKEKEAKKMAEREFDKMWYEVSMKEAEALAARMEYDAIERLRRDRECKEYSDYQVEMNKRKREREREILRQEALLMKQRLDEADRKEAEAERQRQAKRDATNADLKRSLLEQQALAKKQAEDNKCVNDTWDSLAGQGLADQKAKEELRRRKERELDECNRKLIEVKQDKTSLEEETDRLIARDAQFQQDITDQRRCNYVLKQQKITKEIQAALVDQIKDREVAREEDRKAREREDEYNRQLQSQIQKLVDHKELTDAQARKAYQKTLLDQIDYNKLLKERAWKEEMEQREKCKAAALQYEEEVKRMLCRPFFSEEIHPFMKQMAKGLKLQEKCPCSKTDYCAVPVHNKETYGKHK